MCGGTDRHLQALKNKCTQFSTHNLHALLIGRRQKGASTWEKMVSASICESASLNHASKTSKHPAILASRASPSQKMACLQQCQGTTT